MKIEAKKLTEQVKFLSGLHINFCILNLQGVLVESDCCEDLDFATSLQKITGQGLEKMIHSVVQERDSQSFATPSGATKFVTLVPIFEEIGVIGVLAVGFDTARDGAVAEGKSELMGPQVKRRTRQLIDALQHLESEMEARKRAESQHRQLEAQMLKTKRLETLGSFAGGIAHEFNNMLTVILGNIGLVQMQISEDSPASEAISSLEVASLRAAQLTSQLLSFSGRSRGSMTMVSLSKLVQEFAPLLRISATGECELSLETAANLPRFSGDVGQLQEVLVGLVTNSASSYGPSGGKICINTGVVTMGKSDFLSCHIDDGFEAGEWVYLDVIDYGSGISERVQKHMFDPFFSTSKKATGLGLSACLGIVRSHGGTMSVDSKLSEGTVVRVLFPATLESKEEAAVEPMVIMVVDNDPAVLEITRNLLHNLDHEALAVGSGQEAVELFMNRNQEIDGVLLDKTMPGMSGLECFHQIKAIDFTTPVVIMTGFDESSVESDFGPGRVTAILPKPFQVSGLKEALSSIQLSVVESRKQGKGHQR